VITYSDYLANNLPQDNKYIPEELLRRHCREAMVQALEYFSGDAMPI
jgi:hypothetical protein